MEKHTPGPWKAEFKSTWPQIVCRDKGRHDGEVVAFEICNGTDFGKANAARIVACVNACEGINPEAVPDLLAALEFCVEALSVEAPIYKAHIEQARAAIAKAKGE